MTALIWASWAADAALFGSRIVTEKVVIAGHAPAAALFRRTARDLPNYLKHLVNPRQHCRKWCAIVNCRTIKSSQPVGVRRDAASLLLAPHQPGLLALPCLGRLVV